MIIPDHKTIDEMYGLLHPTARERRNKFYQKNGRFVHYTSAENALKIIKSGQIWMTNAQCMNDYMEIRHGYNLLIKFFNSQAGADFKAALDQVQKEFADATIRAFMDWWHNLLHNTFICSISEHDDDEDNSGRLSMWRAYGAESAKVAIVTKMPYDPANQKSGLNILLHPVAYYDDIELTRELSTVTHNIKTNIALLTSIDRDLLRGFIIVLYILCVTSIKSKGFKEEREWRIIYIPALYPVPSKQIESGIECMRGIPQVVYKLPLTNNIEENGVDLSIKHLLSRIIIGPTQFPYVIGAAFKKVLEEATIPDANKIIGFSSIPLREK